MTVKKISQIRLTDFMKALGQESPVATDGNLCVYNAPYDDKPGPTMVIDTERNLWRDTKSGAYGGIFDLAYELTGSTSMRQLVEYIEGQMANIHSEVSERSHVGENTTMSGGGELKMSIDAVGPASSNRYIETLFPLDDAEFLRQIQPYLNTLKENNDLSSGDRSLLPSELCELHEVTESLFSKALMFREDNPEMDNPYVFTLNTYAQDLAKAFDVMQKRLEKATGIKYINPLVNMNINDFQPPQKSAMEQKKDLEQDAQTTQAAQTSPVEETDKEKRAVRKPQMITVNGDKVSHAHVFASSTKPDVWFFCARLNGQPLRPQVVDTQDRYDFMSKKLSVSDMMAIYYPTKILEKVPAESFNFPVQIDGPDGKLNIEKFNIYKESDETKEDYGKYKFFARVDGRNMSCLASPSETSAYFDRVMTPADFVESKFGERLHLKSHYERFTLPADIDESKLKVILMEEKGRADSWKIKVQMPDGQETETKPLKSHDAASLLRYGTATKPQLAVKYFATDIRSLAMNPKQSANNGLKTTM